MAFAPPPGTTLRSRCLRMRTGASRETREISPKINSSATRSPSTVTVTLGKSSTIFLSRSVSLRCLLISVWSARTAEGRDALGTAGVTPALHKAPPIFSRLASFLRNPGHHGIHSVSCVGQLHFDRNHGERRQRQVSAQIDCVLFCSHKTVSLAALSQVQQITDVLIGIGVVVAVEGFSDRLDAGGPQLRHEI